MFDNEIKKILQIAKDYAVKEEKENPITTIEHILAAIAEFKTASYLLFEFYKSKNENLKFDQITFPKFTKTGRIITAKVKIDPIVKEIFKTAQKFNNDPQKTRTKGDDIITLIPFICAIVNSPDVANKLKNGMEPLSTEICSEILANSKQISNFLKLKDYYDSTKSIKKFLLKNIFGQNRAIKSFINGLDNMFTKSNILEEKKGVLACFTFIGPPGVGKSFLAELVSSQLKRPFKRFNMTSYSMPSSYQELIGLPKVFPGKLSQFVIDNPNAILLFDEIEKADIHTINLFHQILDNGKLYDNYMEKNAIFSKTIIIFTTNAGRTLYDSSSQLKFSNSTILSALEEESDRFKAQKFPKSLLSRLNQGYLILFNHLSINELIRIIKSKLEKLEHGFKKFLPALKTIDVDERIPYLMLLKGGANTDAREINANIIKIFTETLTKIVSLSKNRDISLNINKINNIIFKTDDFTKNLSDFVISMQNSKILIFTSPAIKEIITQNSKLPKNIDLHFLDSSSLASEKLFKEDFDMILLDPWCGSEKSKKNVNNLNNTANQFKHDTIIESKALFEGRKILEIISNRFSEIPLYLLSISNEIFDSHKQIDENLYFNCSQICKIHDIIHLEVLFEEDSIRNPIETTLESLKFEKFAQNLNKSHKILEFDIVPKIDRELPNEISVFLRNFEEKSAFDTGDIGQIIEDVERPNISFEDVFGVEQAKKELSRIIEWLVNPKKYRLSGILSSPKGILFSGDPGTGKTLLARALAGESKCSFIQVAATSFVTEYQGSGPSNIRKLFDRARRYSPTILFIDEIDAIGIKRGGTGFKYGQENALNALLFEMDGFQNSNLNPVIVIGATNLEKSLDKALIRRFDKTIKFVHPNKEERHNFLKYMIDKVPKSSINMDTIEEIAKLSIGMTFADLEKIIKDATWESISKNQNLNNEILQESFDILRIGYKNKIPDEDTLSRIAVHEAGHALLSCLEGLIPLQATIIGRESAGGYVIKDFDEEKIISTKHELESEIRVSLAGRAAELFRYSEEEGLSTGAESDLMNASNLARNMIKKWAMYTDIPVPVYNDDSYYSQSELSLISNKISDIIKNEMGKTFKKIEKNKLFLNKIYKDLLKSNVLKKNYFKELSKKLNFE